MRLIKKLKKSILPDRWSNKEEDIWFKIRYFFYDKLSRLQGMLERLYEVMLFIPVIYSVVRWDYSSLFVILEHWLKRMEDVHRTDELHEDNELRANEIKECLDILKRINADEYLEIAFKEHDKKWGESTYWFEPVEDNPEYSTYHSTRENIKTEEDKELERKEARDCLLKEDELRNVDVTLLFEIIRKHHQGWWC